MIDLPLPIRQALARDGEGLRLLVVRLGALGDVMRTLPAVRLLRRGLPRAALGWVVDGRWAPLLRDHPDLDAVIACPRDAWQRDVRSPARWGALWRDLRETRRRVADFGADLTLDFHGNLRSGVTAGWSGSPVRLGFDGHQQREGNRRFSTHRVPSGPRRRSRIERNLDLVRALGVADAPLPLGGLVLPARAATEAAAALGPLAGRRHALVVPGASRRQAYKRPPARLLGAACRRLARRGIAPLVVWGPNERPWADRVVDEAGGNARLAPATGLLALAALVREAELVVCGDSGPLHLACASGRPVLALYGPTDPRVNAPWGVPYRALHAGDGAYVGIKRLDRRNGFAATGESEVTAALDQLLAETNVSVARRAGGAEGA